MSQKELVNQLYKNFVLQKDQSFNVIACLEIIIKYHDGEANQPQLRASCGYSKQGVSLIGLTQGAKAFGLTAEAFESDIETLKEAEIPVILQTIKFEDVVHYLICYGYKEGKFIIGDPGWGILEYLPEELEAVWKSHILVYAEPNENFEKREITRQKKKEWLIRHLRKNIDAIIILISIGAITASITLGLIRFLQQFVNIAVSDFSMRSLLIITGLITFLLLINSLILNLRNKLINRHCYFLYHNISVSFMEKLISIPGSLVKDTPTGITVPAFLKAQELLKLIRELIFFVASEPFIFLGTLIYLFILSPLTVFVLLLSIPVLYLIIRVFHSLLLDNMADEENPEFTSIDKYINIFGSKGLIKSFNKENYFMAYLTNVYKDSQKYVYSQWDKKNKIKYRINVFFSLFFIAVIFHATYLLVKNIINTGQWISVTSLSLFFLHSLRQIAIAYLKYRKLEVIYNYRITDLLMFKQDYKIDQTNLNSEMPCIPFDTIKVCDMNFRFPGRTLSLKKLNFQLEKGKITGIYGNMGSGKSIIRSILSRDYEFESGTILLDNNNWEELNNYEWRKSVAVVKGDEKLIKGTVYENICLDNANRHFQNVLDICEKYGFDTYIKSVQSGFATIINEEASNISACQRQIIAFARALYHNPKVLILDEATAMMDKKTEESIISLINGIKSDIIVLLLSSRADLILESDIIYNLAEKSLSAPISPEHFRKEVTEMI